MNADLDNLQECMNPLYSCSLEIENTSHYLLQYHHFTLHCNGLMNSVKLVCDSIESMTDENKLALFLFGDLFVGDNKNKMKLEMSITYIVHKITNGCLSCMHLNLNIVLPLKKP